MKRIGMFTGNIYNEETDMDKVDECCVQCENPTAEDIHNAKITCILCHGGCPNKETVI